VQAFLSFSRDDCGVNIGRRSPNFRPFCSQKYNLSFDRFRICYVVTLNVLLCCLYVPKYDVQIIMIFLFYQCSLVVATCSRCMLYITTIILCACLYYRKELNAATLSDE
jgi:hypothetical protein